MYRGFWLFLATTPNVITPGDETHRATIMELVRLIEGLANPAAYPHPVDRVEVLQTHISVVFLAGPFAYKLKKPVDLGFLDFTTLSKRQHFCEEEVRLNRRLAPTVYLGVVPVVSSPDGVRLDYPGEVIEWAVKMERLPDGASLLYRIQRDDVRPELVIKLANRVAEFHRHAESGPRIASFGRFDVVAGNARENFTQATAQVGITVSQFVFDRLRALTNDVLERLRGLIESRAERDVPRDTHGDLHLDHVYYFPDREPPSDLIAIDCIEFNERFRFADPVADAAFLAMDLTFRGRRDLADTFTAAYFRASGDEEGRALLPFYTAYRAVVRGKVEGLRLPEPEIPAEQRTAAAERARAYWLLALGELEQPGRRPCVVMVGGLPGTGKSTLARGLAAHGNFTVIRSDVVRKELAGHPANTPAKSELDQGLYSPEWTQRTYAECLRQTEDLLFEGKRVIVDANFASEHRRRAFLAVARRYAVPAMFLHCTAGSEVARQRLANRSGDVSDADVDIYEQLASRWEPVGPFTQSALHIIDTNGEPGETLALAEEVLRQARLLESDRT